MLTPAVATMLAASLALPGHAQTQASTVPISRHTVTLRLVLDQTPATVTIQNGALARLAVKDGPTLGLVPAIAGRKVDLLVVEIVPDPNTGNEGVRQLTKARLAAGVVIHLDAPSLPLAVELLPNAVGPSQRDITDGPCTTCCVTCGAYTVCACWVEMECGRCCCPNACACPWPPDTRACSTAVQAAINPAHGR